MSEPKKTTQKVAVNDDTIVVIEKDFCNAVKARHVRVERLPQKDSVVVHSWSFACPHPTTERVRIAKKFRYDGQTGAVLAPSLSKSL
jgi:hypothetical protein